MSSNPAKRPDLEAEQFWLLLVFLSIIALLLGLCVYQDFEIAHMPQPCITIPDAR